MLSVKKVLAGRGAVDYYLGQVRRGLADYYLPEATRTAEPGGAPRLTAPGASWWGGGAEALGLSGEVRQREFVPLYAKGARPDGGYLGHRFRLPEQATAARDAALAEAATIADPYDRWMAQHEIRSRGWRASVAAWDCTFSPVKSVSLLWASGDHDVQQQVWAAHVAAVDAGLAYLESHAAYVRAGRNGVRVHDTTGLVVARMNEWTSRDGDMQLHTHCLVLNRAQTADDGKWRALDGRCLLAARTGAGAVYNRVLEAELTRRLGVAWRDRPDGLRELVGVDDELIEAFSSRRRSITARVAELASAYEQRYGIAPAPAVLSSMAQSATLTTRRRKVQPDPDTALDAWEATARDHGARLRDLPAKVLGRARPQRQTRTVADERGAVVARLAASGRATFTRHDVLRAALDVIPPANRSATDLEAAAHQLTDQVLASPDVVTVSAPDVLDTPPSLRRRDGTSLFDRPERHRWALPATLDQEAWLLRVATERHGTPPPADLLTTASQAHGLAPDQTDAVRELLGTDRRIGLLVGPAGAGKTRTLRAVVDAWQRTGGTVIGLTVSQSAAQILATEAQVRAENTAKWLHETRRGTWRLPDRALVLIDEASMVATADLVDLAAQAREVGGKVLLVGDPAQLSAIHIGGAFDLLADRLSAARLHEVRRFHWEWERDASLKLRRRDPAALAQYAMRNRIHGGPLAEIEDQVFTAWHADATRDAHPHERHTALMIVTTNEQAAVLGERARHALQDAGLVSRGPAVQLRDNPASVGDHLVTRRNDRTLVTSTGGFVVNGDIWTVAAVHPDGAASLSRHRDGATITLLPEYLATHCHLAYATTAHRAQGMTVDRCHALITTESTHEHLYVAATRGRQANHLWVAVDTTPGEVRDPADLPSPEHILTRILGRRDPDRWSAHQVIEDSQHEIGSLARLGAIFEDAARTATETWLASELDALGLGAATDDPAWPTLVAQARQLALAGHDIPALLKQAVAAGSMDDAHSLAGLLHWRLEQAATQAPPARARGPLGSLPPVDGDLIDIAVQAGELMRARWRQLRHDLDVMEALPEWLAPLGPRPIEAAERSAWLTAATAVAAYRERYELPNYTRLIGARPGGLRPDAQAAWDHAQRQADLFAARGLARLTPQALTNLAEAHRMTLASRPSFDPSHLLRAHKDLSGLDRMEVSPVAEVAHHEEFALRRVVWENEAEHATAGLRQLHAERSRPSP